MLCHMPGWGWYANICTRVMIGGSTQGRAGWLGAFYARMFYAIPNNRGDPLKF